MKKENNFYCYWDKTQRDQTAISLIIFGYTQFKRAYIIQNLSKLKSILDKKAKGQISDVDFQNEMSPFLFENLIDAIKICIFFENLMKAALISKMFLIHKIKTNGSTSKLSKDQKFRPISIDEFSTIEKFKLDSTKQILQHDNLLSETITISSMINNSDYSNVFGLSSELLNTIKNLNHKRNQLHFLDSWVLTLSNSTLTELESMDKFATDFIDKMKKP